ncbi:hypothetical protein [Candidatus Rariloculus sp.]|uniref:hypothetical protein n=1 Tax=Candidatus Rariloculus sp. TaxID=3101265 RepID=UPI003D0C2F62
MVGLRSALRAGSARIKSNAITLDTCQVLLASWLYAGTQSNAKPPLISPHSFSWVPRPLIETIGVSVNRLHLIGVGNRLRSSSKNTQSG